MEKPYLKKFSEISGITVWIVDGYYIRQNIDINFNNFGQHYAFNFIPEKEFWLDRQAEPGEENYYIEHLLVEHRLMSEGKSYDDALDEGDLVEQKLRDQDKRIWDLKGRLETDKESVLGEVRKKFLEEYSNNTVRTYIVDSFLVRSLFYIDWVAGGHDKVYPNFVPSNEVWLDNDIVPEEMKYVLAHELHERYQISNGLTYEDAHTSAFKVESYCHKNPEELENKIKEELDRQV